MRTRLNRTGTFDYQVERSNDQWPDHQLRTLVTAAAIAWLKPESILDPACGDGSIAMVADHLHPMKRVLLADISVPNVTQINERTHFRAAANDIETCLRTMPDTVDVIVLTEILEHLEDPAAILRLAKSKAKYLVASSPEMKPGQIDPNPEHLWMFDGDGYAAMLAEAGWRPIQKTHLGFQTIYNFQIWVCE